MSILFYKKWEKNRYGRLGYYLLHTLKAPYQSAEG